MESLRNLDSESQSLSSRAEGSVTSTPCVFCGGDADAVYSHIGMERCEDCYLRGLKTVGRLYFGSEGRGSKLRRTSKGWEEVWPRSTVGSVKVV